MKIYKLTGKKNPVVNRDLISKFGQKIYHSPEVTSVFVKVCFRDGSNIGFTRDEEDDEIEGMMTGENEDS